MSEDAPVAMEAEVEVEAVVEEELPLDPQSALKAVLRTALFHDGLSRGLHEAVKCKFAFSGLVSSSVTFFFLSSSHNSSGSPRGSPVLPFVQLRRACVQQAHHCAVQGTFHSAHQGRELQNPRRVGWHLQVQR